MATDPAARPEYARRLWQFPTFLVGLACLWAVWQAGDRLRPTVADRYRRAIEALRPAVERWPADPDQVQAALRKLPAEDPPSDLAPVVRYLTGSAYVALAESTTSRAEADEWWALARRDLELAVTYQLPPADEKKLRYRLARTWANSAGTDPIRTADALTTYLSAGDDPSEGYRLLAGLYLGASPPNEPKARDCLQSFLSHATARADARTLSQARVKLAELHARLGEPDEARKVLDRVGPEAPAEVYAAAKLLLAGHHKAAADWPAAARVWEQVREMNGATDDQRAAARVGLAEAYVKLDRPAEAERIVQEGPTADSPEGRAVRFRRADLRLKDPAAAIEAITQDLEAAFAGSDQAALRRLVPAADARRVCEVAVTRAIEARQHALAVRVATVYAKVAENGDHHRLMAAAHEAWARTVAGQEATDHSRQAAGAYEMAARVEPTPVRKGDQLRTAARLYSKAGDRAKALSVLGELATAVTGYPDDRLGHVWSDMGDLYLAGGDKEQARLAYQNAAGRPGPARDRARVRFASLAFEADPERGGPTAVAALTDIVDQPPADLTDRPTHEAAAYLLGEVHLLRKEWVPAEARLRAALAAYPQSPKAGRGRYQLAQVLRHGAYEAARKIKADRAELAALRKEAVETRQPSLKVLEQSRIEQRLEDTQKAYDDRMRRAYDEFVAAEKLLLADADAEPAVVRRTLFWAADCAYWLGQFEDCAARCERLVTRYRGTADELEAGRDLHRCCVFAAQAAQQAKDATAAGRWGQRAADAVARLKDAVGRMPATELDGATDVRRRDYWDKWLADNAR